MKQNSGLVLRRAWRSGGGGPLAGAVSGCALLPSTISSWRGLISTMGCGRAPGGIYSLPFCFGPFSSALHLVAEPPLFRLRGFRLFPAHAPVKILHVVNSLDPGGMGKRRRQPGPRARIPRLRDSRRLPGAPWSLLRAPSRLQPGPPPRQERRIFPRRRVAAGPGDRAAPARRRSQSQSRPADLQRPGYASGAAVVHGCKGRTVNSPRRSACPGVCASAAGCTGGAAPFTRFPPPCATN